MSGLFLLSSRQLSADWTAFGCEVDSLTWRGTKPQAGHAAQSRFALRDCDIDFSFDVVQELGHLRYKRDTRTRAMPRLNQLDSVKAVT